MRFAALLLTVLLAACATPPPDAPVHVVWQKVDDPQAACEGAAGRREVFKILGCSRWRESSAARTCTIYAPMPRDERDKERFATLGHELMHCMDGNWHDRWGRMLDEKVREARAPRTGSAAAGGTASAAD